MKSYITTAIPYVNGVPHIGHALDYCLADVYARYLKLKGEEVRVQAGTDEHGSKIFQKAADLDIQVQDYVDQNSGTRSEFIIPASELASMASLVSSVTETVKTAKEEKSK